MKLEKPEGYIGFKEILASILFLTIAKIVIGLVGTPSEIWGMISSYVR